MRPEWLWCLLPAAVLTAILWRQRGLTGSWSAVIDSALLSHLVAGKYGGRSRNLLPWLSACWVLSIVAASGPSFRQIPLPVHQKQDALVIVLDLSYSMKSGDLSPSRIDRARQKLQDLLERREEGQTGLIAFAGDAHIVTPLTDDTRTIANLLPALNPDMMPVPGSDPVAALREAVSLLQSAGISGGRILLVTDAITDAERVPLADSLAESGATLSIMGVGTPTGAPIPLPRGGFLKDRTGAIVMPALDESGLLATAGETGGRYMRLQIDESDLDYLLAEDPLPRTADILAIDRTADTWEDQGYLLLILLAPLVLAMFRRGWIVCLMPLLFLGSPEPAHAGIWDDLWLTPDQQALRALEKGDPQKAATLFKNPAWAGTASYEAGDYDSATEAFSRQDNADSWYNRGNALARSGQFEEAINAYRESLARDPEQTDALENIALLEQLQRQQQTQQGQQNQEDQQQEQQQGQQQDQSETSGGPQGEPQQNGDQRQEQTDQEANDDKDASDRGNRAQNREEQQPGDPSAQSPGESQEQRKDNAQQTPAAEQDTRAGHSDGKNDEQQGQASGTEIDYEQQERDQAMEQWLRRVPDDPSGLLREKFRYQSQQRQQSRTKENDQNW
jgi:Ca-activated chloride channel family protein